MNIHVYTAMHITPRTRRSHLSAPLHEAALDVDPAAIPIRADVQACKRGSNCTDMKVQSFCCWITATDISNAESCTGPWWPHHLHGASLMSDMLTANQS